MDANTGRVAVGTVVSKRYLPFARALADSFRRRHPDVPIFVALSDEVEDCFEPVDEPFPIVPFSELRIPSVRAFLFRYSDRQVAVASKPYLLSHLLDRGFAGALFLDADILVLDEVGDLLECARRHAITLVPHLLAPLEGTDRVARELNILQSGVFNGGVVAVRESATARRFLAWWQERLHTHCRYALEEGMHRDQRWLDLVPSFFDDVHVFRDPGYNVAYWNLQERPLQLVGDERVVLDDGPCRLFHFSGYDPARPDVVTRYWPLLSMADIGEAAIVFQRYRQAVEEAGWSETREWPYANGRFDNGVPIPDIARELYLDLGEEAEEFGDPFRTDGLGSCFDWLNEPVADGITRLWHSVHARRDDLQTAFPDPLGADREAFARWTFSSGEREHSVAAAFRS